MDRGEGNFPSVLGFGAFLLVSEVCAVVTATFLSGGDGRDLDCQVSDLDLGMVAMTTHKQWIHLRVDFVVLRFSLLYREKNKLRCDNNGISRAVKICFLENDFVEESCCRAICFSPFHVNTLICDVVFFP
jgi:hypothetical protein